ncbi:MAG: RdgB/HAM1 family non-canonical purine NTP pyrophosphatase [Roseivirga sp.]|nr:RdgB/HAM1 family non-canonical purine NTP pyrophosphatase [Roseivirga sp.]
MKICFATNNQNKLSEIQQILGDQFHILSLQDIECFDDIPEPYETLEENSAGKAEYIYSRYQIPVFADDTGLEITALKGAPGVYSARYGGPERSAEQNMSKVLGELKEEQDRSARFRTIMTYIDHTGSYQFEGIVEGQIINEVRGAGGFGYDPIFIPSGYSQTFGELPAKVKNKISHRVRSLARLVEFLKSRHN